MSLKTKKGDFNDKGSFSKGIEISGAHLHDNERVPEIKTSPRSLQREILGKWAYTKLWRTFHTRSGCQKILNSIVQCGG